MAEHLQQQRCGGYWCDLCDDDAQPERFCADVLSSLSHADKPIHANSLEAAFEQLNKLTSPAWIVLDNAEVVYSSPQVCSSIEKLIACLVEPIRIAILSREYPKFSIVHALAARQMVLIEDAELAFTQEEISELFHSFYGIDLSIPDLSEILEISEGWTTALVHLAEALDGKPQSIQQDTLKHFIALRQLPSLDQFFSRCIIDCLEDEIRDLLITLSIFPAYTPDLVSSVTGGCGHKILENLLSKSLFLKRIDSSGQLFALHPLFRQHLYGRFSMLADSRQKSIHRAAVDYYYTSGNREAAAHHLRFSRGLVQAKKMLIQEADTLLEQGRYKKLHTLLESFPPDIRTSEPLLMYYYTITTNLVQPFVSRKALMNLLKVFRKSHDVRREAKIHSVLLVNYLFYQGNCEAVTGILSATKDFISEYGSRLDHNVRLTLDTLISFARLWITPDIDNAFEIALRAEETALKIRNEEVLVFAHLILAKVYLDRGDFHRSTEVLEETEILLRHNAALHQYEPLLRFYLGDSYFYLGELTMALDQIEQGLKHIFPQFAFCQYLKLNQVLYLLYVPDLEKAESVLGSIREKTKGENLYVRYYSIYLLHMLLAYRKNNKERAAFYCRRLMDSENKDLLTTDYPYSYIALAEVQTYLGWYKLAEKTLLEVLDDINKDSYPYPSATAYALLGHLKTSSGKVKEGQYHLDIAVDLIAQHGYKNLDICSPVLLRNIVLSISRAKMPESKTFARLKHMSASQIIDQSMVGLNLYTLGDFRIVANGHELSRDTLSRHKKVMDLLKLLIVHRDTGLAKEVSYDLFWAGYLKKSSRVNLNTIIYRLRKVLGEDNPYILTNAGTIRLNRELITVDADDFKALIRTGDKEANAGKRNAALNSYIKAKDIYRGDFLEKDLYYDDIRDERESLQAIYLKLLFKLVIILLDSEKFHLALETNKELLEADKLCEPAYRLLMICCSFVGNRSEIPRLYTRLQDRLLRSFNIQPDPQTTALKNALLNGTSPDPSMWQKQALI